MDSDGMVPAFNASLKALEKMVDHLEKNLCDRVENWTFYEDVLGKYQLQMDATAAGLAELNAELIDLTEGENSFAHLAEISDEIVDSNEEWESIMEDAKKTNDNFDEIFNRTMATANDIICRAADLATLYAALTEDEEKSDSTISERGPRPDGRPELDEHGCPVNTALDTALEPGFKNYGVEL